MREALTTAIETFPANLFEVSRVNVWNLYLIDFGVRNLVKWSSHFNLKTFFKLSNLKTYLVLIRTLIHIAGAGYCLDGSRVGRSLVQRSEKRGRR